MQEVLMQESVPSWLDLLLLAVGTVLIAAITPNAFARLRRRLHERHVFYNDRTSRLCGSIEQRVGALYQALLFVVLISVALLVVATLGRGFVLEALALAAFVVFFSVAELPRLFSPAVAVHVQGSFDFMAPDGRRSRKIALQAGKENLIFFDVVNLGVNHYKDCSIRLTFHDRLRLIADPARYRAIEYRKDFIFEAKNSYLCFLPDGRSIDMPSGGELLVPAIIATPSDQREYDVTVEISCETRAGSTRKQATIKVTQRGST